MGSCCAIAVPAVLAAPGSALASNWTLRQLPPTPLEGGGADEPGLTGVSCPTESLCVAVGGFDTLAFSQAPTAGAAAWHVVHPPVAQPCPEENPHCGKPGSDLQAVSCASQSFCVVASYEGFFYVSTEPTGGADTWVPTGINEPGGHGGTHLTGVSCPSPSLCVAVSSGPSLGNTAGRVFTSTDPTSGSWQVTQLGTRPSGCGAREGVRPASGCRSVRNATTAQTSSSAEAAVPRKSQWRLEVGAADGSANEQMDAVTDSGGCLPKL